MKSLSFIIPVYNGSKHISRCLKSILQQNYPNIEIIIIDDGSTDSSTKIINSTISLYNINNYKTIVLSQKNAGVSATRNKGIQLATSDYIAFVDQDDYIDSNFANTYMSATEKYDYDMVIGGFNRYDKNNKKTREWIPTSDIWSKFCLTYPWGRIIRRIFLIDNSISFLKTGIGEDVYFDLICYSYTDKICMLHNAMYTWFDNPESVSNKQYTYINDKTDPIYTFKHIEHDLSKNSKIPRDLLEYYYIKFIIWFLLSSVQNSKKEDITKTYVKLFSWLRKKYPTYKKNANISLFKPKGDILKNKLCVWGFMQLHKLHIDLPILKLIAKK